MFDGTKWKREERARRRTGLKNLLGNRCAVCGVTDNLEFDHKDRSEKSFNLSGSDLDRPWDIILVELNKCSLLCSQHHLEKSKLSKDFGQVEHGGGKSGKKNCKCSPCKEQKAKYMKEYKKRTKRLSSTSG